MISIIIPVYNVEKYLEDCLNSVLNQSNQNFEIVCINDGSTDRSLDVLKNYTSKDIRIKVVSQENKGLSAARNRGIKEAIGDYIFFLDSDDWLEPNTLQILQRNITDEDLICFNGRRYFEDGTIEKSDYGITENNLSGWVYYNKYALMNTKFSFVCSVLRIYKRDYLLNNNLYFKEGIYHEDNLFTPFAFYYAKKVKAIPDILYVYRIRSGSITQSLNYKKIEDKIHIANELLMFFSTKNDINTSVVFKEIADTVFGQLHLACELKQEDKVPYLFGLLKHDLFFKIRLSPLNKLMYKYLMQNNLNVFIKVYRFKTFTLARLNRLFRKLR